ncbi:carboxymuconolactone decarboxylase family protein [Providencia sp. JGM181]|jgi:AhpD family alkylhydroperoxidase|uniref:carboxymuconolactone decarboxylase family protein n=1 Tax=unclassified Providencia TaxID=2633465 RepID=UPI001BADE283|nr:MULTISPECIES: carboxymuconolactone decarboxylase family protein [unclassified Providencia]MBS0925131.1 carboxymuconolactone decarboxylase family protein [Providencia sp. JGM181]MBS0932216.1 carboxymuconolactone decarboxylase family protein [Providencia sp. JGM172]MBS0996409.1 carboxymuconolactone decarboxylase family protein [Providencia sp. JGM178]
MSKFTEINQNLLQTMPELAEFIPEVMMHFSNLIAAASTEGDLDKKTKELIAIGIAVANRCDGCVAFHTKTLVDLGVTQQELAETLAVAIFMGGGPSVMYATQTWNAYKEFTGHCE